MNQDFIQVLQSFLPAIDFSKETKVAIVVNDLSDSISILDGFVQPLTKENFTVVYQNNDKKLTAAQVYNVSLNRVDFAKGKSYTSLIDKLSQSFAQKQSILINVSSDDKFENLDNCKLMIFSQKQSIQGFKEQQHGGMFSYVPQKPCLNGTEYIYNGIITDDQNEGEHPVVSQAKKIASLQRPGHRCTALIMPTLENDGQGFNALALMINHLYFLSGFQFLYEKFDHFNFFQNALPRNANLASVSAIDYAESIIKTLRRDILYELGVLFKLEVACECTQSKQYSFIHVQSAKNAQENSLNAMFSSEIDATCIHCDHQVRYSNNIVAVSNKVMLITGDTTGDLPKTIYMEHVQKLYSLIGWIQQVSNDVKYSYMLNYENSVVVCSQQGIQPYQGPVGKQAMGMYLSGDFAQYKLENAKFTLPVQSFKAMCVKQQQLGQNVQPQIVQNVQPQNAKDQSFTKTLIQNATDSLQKQQQVIGVQNDIIAQIQKQKFIKADLVNLIKETLGDGGSSLPELSADIDSFLPQKITASLLEVLHCLNAINPWKYGPGVMCPYKFLKLITDNEDKFNFIVHSGGIIDFNLIFLTSKNQKSQVTYFKHIDRLSYYSI